MFPFIQFMNLISVKCYIDRFLLRKILSFVFKVNRNRQETYQIKKYLKKTLLFRTLNLSACRIWVSAYFHRGPHE